MITTGCQLDGMLNHAGYGPLAMPVLNYLHLIHPSLKICLLW